MRKRTQPASVLEDLRRSGGELLGVIRQREDTSSGVGSVGSPHIGPGAIMGPHYAETRNVIPFSFDDSIDPSFPLECLFVMPAGVKKIYSAKLYVRAAPFRAYETGSTGGGSTTASSSGGTGTGSIDASGAHSHSINVVSDSTSTAGGGTTDAQGTHSHSVSISATSGSQGVLHTHTTSDVDTAGDVGSGSTSTESSNHSHSVSDTVTSGNDGSHSHNLNANHWHAYDKVTASTTGTTDHTHTFSGISHTHTVTLTDHTHGITYGIFESAASLGTLSAKIADDGVTYGAAVATGASITVDVKSYLSMTAGDRGLRVETAGVGAQARVKVLLMLDVLLTVDLG